MLGFQEFVKLGDKEQIGIKEPFPVTNLPVYFILDKELLALRNNFRNFLLFVPYHQVRLYLEKVVIKSRYSLGRKKSGRVTD